MSKGYIPLEVYRHTGMGDCSNGGVSSIHNTIYIKVEGGNLKGDNLPSNLKFWYEDRGKGYWAVFPETILRPQGVLMYGGNLAATSDGRSPANVFHIHDRFER